MFPLLYLTGVAQATVGFDPTRVDATFTGPETWSHDGGRQIWGRIERLSDPDRTLLAQEEFNSALAWPDTSELAPHIGECFGDSRPPSWEFLLHEAPHAGTATRHTPVLLVHGAGDNASRSFETLAGYLDRQDFKVFAITFAHPHGDVYRQAEVVADAIARIKVVTGADEVDVIGHSKGGPPVMVYLASGAAVDWSDGGTGTAYQAVGTRYRGDVRRALFLGSPLGGLDTSFRWPSGNAATVYAGPDEAIAPSPWDAWYPTGTTAWWYATDLAAVDFLPQEGDVFPGQRQLLARWDDVYALPGAQPWLGAYAVQQDWWTTYEGGTGFYSTSDGIDAAIAAGGGLLDKVREAGADPDVELAVLAGSNPVMIAHADDTPESAYGEAWGDVVAQGADGWGAFVGALAENAGLVVSGAEVQGLISGDLLLGEISGPSDGLLFVDSATDTAALTARGARVLDVYVADVAHRDLTFCGLEKAEELARQAEDDPVGHGWAAAVAERCAAADTLGWIAGILARDESGEDEEEEEDEEEDSEDGPEDGADTGETDSGVDSWSRDRPSPRGAGTVGCAAVDGTGAGGLGLLLAGLSAGCVRRRGARASG